MKQFLTVAFVAALTIVGVEKAFAEDYDTSQHNLKIDMGKWDFESRQTVNSDKDHIQIGRDLTEDINVQLRYTDAEDAETRIRSTIDVLNVNGFYLKQRIEWRHFENSDDYGRIRPIIGYSNMINPGLKAYIDYQTSFNFDKEGEDNDFKIDAGQVKVGFDYRVHTFMKIGPFIQWEHDNDFDKSNVFLGTNITFEF